MSNEDSLDLVCTTKNNEEYVYPLVQGRNRPIITGQSSQIAPNIRRPGAGPGALVCAEYRRAKSLRDIASEQNLPILAPSGYDPSGIIFNSSSLSNGSDQVVLSQSGERVVGPQGQRKNGGPYTCKRCGYVFEISQALASHMSSHYRAEETMEERKARQARKYKRENAHALEKRIKLEKN